MSQGVIMDEIAEEDFHPPSGRAGSTGTGARATPMSRGSPSDQIVIMENEGQRAGKKNHPEGWPGVHPGRVEGTAGRPLRGPRCPSPSHGGELYQRGYGKSRKKTDAGWRRDLWNIALLNLRFVANFLLQISTFMTVRILSAIPVVRQEAGAHFFRARTRIIRSRSPFQR